MRLHLSPTSLPPWALWAAFFLTCLPLWAPWAGPHDLFVSHLSPTLVSHSERSGPHDFTFPFVSHACLPLWVLWAAWFYMCLPLVSDTWWVPWAAWFYICLHLASHSGWSGPRDFALVSHLSPTLSALGRVILHVSPTCLPHLVATLNALGRMILHLSPTCLPHLPPTLGALGCMTFTLVFHLPPSCLPLWLLRAACFTFVSHLSPTCLPHVSPALGALGRVILHVSPTCLPLWALWATCFYICPPPILVSHSGCSGPHAFTFVPHLSPILVSHSGCSGPYAFTCVSHLFPTWLPLWKLWAAWFYTCLPLWMVWAAWFYTCLPLVFHAWRKICCYEICASFRVSLQHWTLLHLFGVDAGIIYVFFFNVYLCL